MTKGTWITWSAKELAWIKANSRRPRAETYAEFVVRFARPDVSMSNLAALCKRKGWFTGNDGRFVKGQQTWNAGKKCEPGKGGRHPNCKATQFKKGCRTGIATKLYKPVGTERMSRSGYLERKIHDGLPLQSRWRAVHLLNWEQVNGPLPKGMALKCLDGNRLNADSSNWIAVPRALLPRLAGGRWGRVPYDQAPAELKPAILAIAQLEHAARERGKQPSRIRKQLAPNEQ